MMSETVNGVTVGLCSSPATLSARQSLKIDVQHLLTLSGELDTSPPTSYEPLLSNLIPPPPSKKKNT